MVSLARRLDVPLVTIKPRKRRRNKSKRKRHSKTLLQISLRRLTSSLSSKLFYRSRTGCQDVSFRCLVLKHRAYSTFDYQWQQLRALQNPSQLSIITYPKRQSVARNVVIGLDLEKYLCIGMEFPHAQKYVSCRVGGCIALIAFSFIDEQTNAQ
jgi:hypothetical protein